MGINSNISKLFVSSALLLSLSTSHTFAQSDQFFDPIDGMLDASEFLSNNTYGFLPVPIIITDPALEGGLGMMGLFFHESEEEKVARLDAMKNSESAASHLMPPSVSAVLGAYTGNNSYFTGGGHLGFFNQGKIRYMGGAGYGNVNLDFFGFGEIELPKPISIKTEAIGIMQSLKFKLADSAFYLGPTQRYINAEISPENLGDLGGILPPDWEDELTDILTNDITTSGLGFTLEYDSRDNIFTPTNGIKYDLTSLWFDETIGSDLDFFLTEFSGLHYLQLNEQWRTAFRVEILYADADGFLPTYATPGIKLRGIQAGRYQGKSVAVSEFELTYQFNLRWSANAFTGIGKATNEFSDLTDAASRISKGVGFRYLIARRYGFNMGIDVAKGPEDTVFYIQAGSAW